MLPVLLIASLLAAAPVAAQKETSAALKEYRILSVVESAKLVLISDLTAKTRFLLDASQAKILIEGQEADLKALAQYSSARFEFNQKSKSHEGVTLDGEVVRVVVQKKN